MDLPDPVFDAEHKNVLAALVGPFTAVLPQRTVAVMPLGDWFKVWFCFRSDVVSFDNQIRVVGYLAPFPVELRVWSARDSHLGCLLSPRGLHWHYQLV